MRARSAVLLVVVATACGPGRDDGAEPSRYGVGRPATAAEVAALDHDVDTSGHGLPPGRGSVAEGATIYAAKCAACHGAAGEGITPNPKLVQPIAAGSAADSFPFDRDFKIPKTVGNYWPYATTLYDYLRQSMPYDHPGTLTPNETYALVAWLLAEHAILPRSAVLDSAALRRVVMPARGRFVPDDRRGGPVVR